MEQTKAMSSNKKLTIAIVAMAVALLAVVGGLIGVWAATQQTVQTSFNVQYSIGENIAATVTASYATVDNKQTDTKSETFDATTAEQTFSLALGDITLDPTNTSVTFTYTFKNNSAVAFTATLTDTSKAANVTISYDGDTDTTQEVTSTTASAVNGTTSVAVGANATATVTITVAVKDVNASTASYVSDATNGITWVLA